MHQIEVLLSKRTIKGTKKSRFPLHEIVRFYLQQENLPEKMPKAVKGLLYKRAKLLLENCGGNVEDAVWAVYMRKWVLLPKKCITRVVIKSKRVYNYRMTIDPKTIEDMARCPDIDAIEERRADQGLRPSSSYWNAKRDGASVRQSYIIRKWQPKSWNKPQPQA